MSLGACELIVLVGIHLVETVNCEDLPKPGGLFAVQATLYNKYCVSVN